MSDIDLIPDYYRRLLELKRWLKYFLVCSLAIILIGGFARITLSTMIKTKNAEIEQLQNTESSIESSKSLLTTLNEQKASVARKIKVLNSLHNGPSTQKLFTAIDNAMSKDVWFLSMDYLEPLPPASSNKQNKNGGQLEHANESGNPLTSPPRIEIKGQALSHTVLANFVNQLIQQPELESVQIVNTQLRHYTRTEVVDFHLTVTARMTTGALQ